MPNEASPGHCVLIRSVGLERRALSSPQLTGDIHRNGPVIHAGIAFPPSLGVDHLPDGIDLAPHLVVLAELAGDLVAGVQDGRMIASA